MAQGPVEIEVKIPADDAVLTGDLAIPAGARGLVVFVHGSGSSRLSPRNRAVAEDLRDAGFGTLLFDLLTEAEDEVYDNRFNIPLLTRRLLAAAAWLRQRPDAAKLKLGYFGASTGAAAALYAAAADTSGTVAAVVSRGGRPDLSMDELERVKAPTLLIVGGDDLDVLELNRQALAALRSEKDLQVVPGATHLFEEPGALEEVSNLAADWFTKYLAG